jgi:hypothetical protein
MKNQITVFVTTLITLLLVASFATAETTIGARLAMSQGKPVYDLSLLTPWGEGYIFNAGGESQSWEYGALWPVHKGCKSTLLVGGYAALWTINGQWSAEPYLYGSLQLPAKLTLDGTLGSYIPIGRKGDVVVYTDTIALTRQFGGWSAGPCFTFWAVGDDPFQMRPAAVARTKKAELRWVPPVAGLPGEIRVKYSLGF